MCRWEQESKLLAQILWDHRVSTLAIPLWNCDKLALLDLSCVDRGWKECREMERNSHRSVKFTTFSDFLSVDSFLFVLRSSMPFLISLHSSFSSSWIHVKKWRSRAKCAHIEILNLFRHFSPIGTGEVRHKQATLAFGKSFRFAKFRRFSADEKKSTSTQFSHWHWQQKTVFRFWLIPNFQSIRTNIVNWLIPILWTSHIFLAFCWRAPIFWPWFSFFSFRRKNRYGKRSMEPDSLKYFHLVLFSTWLSFVSATIAPGSTTTSATTSFAPVCLSITVPYSGGDCQVPVSPPLSY